MSLLQMSFYGGVMVLAIWGIRAFALHRLPKATFLVLWDAALVRLLIPYALPFRWSIYALLSRPMPTAQGGSPAPVTIAAPDAVKSGVTEAASVIAAPTRSPWGILWAVGTLLLAGYFAAAYCKGWNIFRMSLPVESPLGTCWLEKHRILRPIALRQSDRITAPLTYGIFRPVILLPKLADREDEKYLPYVLAHELVHIRRFDAVTKLALTTAVCIHWFNPAVWLLYLFANRDMELRCDEAVLHSLGMDKKAAYARMLIRMEEHKSGLPSLYSHFSQNAVQERILAIMKIRKISMAALLAAILLTICVTTAFATSAQSDAPMQEMEVTTYTDPEEGRTYYSWDGGTTWTAMTEEDLEAKLHADPIEWWTEEEYAAWLENEKVQLREILGSRGWTPSTGWFTWDQERIDETIALYEGTLELIKSGIKISKPFSDENGEIAISSHDPATIESRAVNTGVVIEPEPAQEELLKEYGRFGISFGASGKMLYNGKPVRWFADGVDTGDSWFCRYTYRDDQGTEYIRTVRETVDNGDGSVNVFGPLTGIVPLKAGELDRFGFLFQGGLEEAVAEGNSETMSGTSFEDRFARYREFGITYVEGENSSGAGNVYFNGQPVRQFSDVTPDGGAFSFTSGAESGIRVRTVYDARGLLSGVEIVP